MGTVVKVFAWLHQTFTFRSVFFLVVVVSGNVFRHFRRQIISIRSCVRGRGVTGANSESCPVGKLGEMLLKHHVEKLEKCPLPKKNKKKIEIKNLIPSSEPNFTSHGCWCFCSHQLLANTHVCIWNKRIRIAVLRVINGVLVGSEAEQRCPV